MKMIIAFYSIFFLCRLDVTLLEQCHTSLNQVCDRLNQVVAKFVLPETGESTQLVQSLTFILHCLKGWSEEYEVWSQSIQRSEYGGNPFRRLECFLCLFCILFCLQIHYRQMIFCICAVYM